MAFPIDASEERFRLVAQISSDVIWDWNLLTHQIWWSDGLTKLFGYPIEQQISHPNWWRDYIHPDDRERVVSSIHAALHGTGIDWQDSYRYRHADGNYLEVQDRGRILRDAQGKAVRMVGAMQDLSTVKAAEFRSLADALPQIVWIANPSGAAEYFNKLWYDFTGLSETDSLGPDRWKLAYHPEDVAHLRTRWDHSLTSGVGLDVQYRIRSADGAYRWFLCRGQPMRDEQGRLVRWFGTLTDIHDRILAEEQLNEQSEFNRSILDSSTDGIKVLDLEGRLLSMNTSGREHLEMSDVSAYLMRDWLDFWQGDMHTTASQAVQAALAGETSYFEGFRTTALGSPKWWEVIVSPVCDSKGAVQRILVVSRDITERRQKDAEFRQLADAMPQIVWIAKPDGMIEYFNSQWYQYTGLDNAQSDGSLPWSSAFLPEDLVRVEERWGHAVRSGEDYEMEYRIRRQDGELRWFLARALPVRDARGTITRWFGTCTDIHDKMTSEHKLRQAMEQAEAASMAKTEFLANMSHEIRTPMNAVVGLSTILSNSPGLTEKQREFVSTLQVSAEQLLQLINDLLDLSRIESHGMHLESIPFDLNRIVHEVVNINSVSGREKHIAITARGHCAQQLIGDPLRIKQVVMNLVGNAVKFTEEGSVSVNVFCATRVGSRMVDLMIAVEDTGIGIPASKVEDIFGKFSQAESSTSRRFGGSGLGLSIAKTLVELMGGQITVNSKPGKGSCFTVTLALPTVSSEKDAQDLKPATVKKKNPMPETASTQAPNAATKVLLVEDYHANVLVATMLLQNYGYEYELASTGEEALKKVEEQEFAVVLMDVQMPQMNGYQATAVIRENEAARGDGRRLPIVGMTAHALKGDRERCIEAGMDDYIAKPFRPETLKAVLEKYSAPATVQLAD